MSAKLHLTVVSQEKSLVDTNVDMVTATSSEGDLTILPQHIPLFTKLTEGILKYQDENESNQIIVSRGFLSVDNKNQVTVMVDSAVHERDVSLEKAQQAVDAAQKAMETSVDRRELLMAEASLKRALLEIRVAQKTKKTSL